ncbi:hypothetical protein S40288_02453, partial [Stachybotrys chartarum IBT 40288]
ALHPHKLANRRINASKKGVTKASRTLLLSEHMDSSLHEVWQAAAGRPFYPAVDKANQFIVASVLLLIGLLLTGFFALSKINCSCFNYGNGLTDLPATDRSLVTVPLIGIPSSLAIACVFSLKKVILAAIANECSDSASSTCSALSESTSKIPLPNKDYKFGSARFSLSIMPTQGQPILRAVATSTRPLYQLLRCINFAPTVHVQITEDGIRFAADVVRVMQGVAFLDSTLFTAYTVNLPQSEDGAPPALPNFQIPLSALLEVLQIFGAVDVATRAQKAEQDAYRGNFRNYRTDAFSNQTLGISGTCTLLYAEEGDAFKITIEETGVKTTAALTTYVPEIPEQIPFDRDDLTFKIIMQSRSLLDCLAEISPTAPVKLAITATKTSPYLALSGTGDLGSAAVDFARGKDLLEVFTIQQRWSQSYRFDFIKNSTEAMRIANKVSLRGDGQGVLSLQFMVDVEGGKRSFLDFRFVPFTQNAGDDDEDEQDTNENDDA